MASYSSGIQLDVDSISLSPSEIRDAILNDGTEFSGSDIDTSISSRSSHDPSDIPTAPGPSDLTTNQFDLDINNKFLNVSGSGFLTLYVQPTGGRLAYADVEIDGAGFRINVDYVNNNETETLSSIPFSNSVNVDWGEGRVTGIYQLV